MILQGIDFKGPRKPKGQDLSYSWDKDTLLVLISVPLGESLDIPK